MLFIHVKGNQTVTAFAVIHKGLLYLSNTKYLLLLCSQFVPVKPSSHSQMKRSKRICLHIPFWQVLSVQPVHIQKCIVDKNTWQKCIVCGKSNMKDKYTWTRLWRITPRNTSFSDLNSTWHKLWPPKLDYSDFSWLSSTRVQSVNQRNYYSGNYKNYQPKILKR